MRRRTVLGLPALGAAALTLSACDEREGEDADVAPSPTKQTIRYGDDPSQYGELRLPQATPRGVVVVIHGGFWKAEYDASLGRPLAVSLVAEGWAAWNLEYRRVGNGGGNPGTLDDVAAGIDKLADLELDLTTVVTLGHSAGGHLAVWAAGRGKYDQWTPEVAVTAVISQAGVLDLRSAHAAGLGGGAVEAMLGHAPTTADEPVDPIQQVSLDVPVWCVHGTADDIVPLSQSRDYVAAATAAGAEAELLEVEGDHFVVIDPASAAWTAQLEILERLA